jgi:hypothetical protein
MPHNQKKQTHADGTIELWRDVPGWEGLYRVSDRGRVKSLPRTVRRGRGNGYVYTFPGKILQTSGKHEIGGYPTIKLVGKNRKRQTTRIHTLVLTAFVGPRPKGMECCHFPDGNPQNNKLENLSWGTNKENKSHRLIHGTDARGIKCPTAKLSNPDSEVPKIHRLCIARKTSEEIGLMFGISRGAVDFILKGKTYVSSQPPMNERAKPRKKGPRPGKTRKKSH